MIQNLIIIIFFLFLFFYGRLTWFPVAGVCLNPLTEPQPNTRLKKKKKQKKKNEDKKKSGQERETSDQSLLFFFLTYHIVYIRNGIETNKSTKGTSAPSLVMTIKDRCSWPWPRCTWSPSPLFFFFFFLFLFWLKR